MNIINILNAKVSKSYIINLCESLGIKYEKFNEREECFEVYIYTKNQHYSKLSINKNKNKKTTYKSITKFYNELVNKECGICFLEIKNKWSCSDCNYIMCAPCLLQIFKHHNCEIRCPQCRMCLCNPDIKDTLSKEKMNDAMIQFSNVFNITNKELSEILFTEEEISLEKDV